MPWRALLTLLALSCVQGVMPDSRNSCNGSSMVPPPAPAAATAADVPCPLSAALCPYASPPWEDAADAIVMIAATEAGSGGELCTGALIAAPNASDALVLTATRELLVGAARRGRGPQRGATQTGRSHDLLPADCRNMATVADVSQWAVIFGDHKPCPVAGDPANASAAASGTVIAEAALEVAAAAGRVSRGAEVLWQSEASDVLLLRLVNGAPAGLRPYFLGWDASAWQAGAAPTACLHHPLGAALQAATSSAPLRAATYEVG